MKPKKVQNALKLNKSTVSNLSNHALSKVLGGACTFPATGCDSLYKICCSLNPNTCTSPPYCNSDLGCSQYPRPCDITI